MAYNFLELVNQVNRRFNEVELTSASFATAKGFYGSAKDSVNAAIRDVTQSHFEWTFNHANKEETLVAGTTRYAIPNSTSSIDYNSFRIKKDDALGNATTKLNVLTYEEYLKRFVDQEYTTDTGTRGLPLYVIQAPSEEYLVSPAPDQAYTLVFEYYTIPTDLSLYSDVPTIPERFKHVIIDGAMYHAYMFRGNEQSAAISKQKFDEGIKRMRTILINRYTYMSSSYITPSGSNISGPRLI